MLISTATPVIYFGDRLYSGGKIGDFMITTDLQGLGYRVRCKFNFLRRLGSVGLERGQSQDTALDYPTDNFFW
jgi:hypothetical protein